MKDEAVDYQSVTNSSFTIHNLSLKSFIIIKIKTELYENDL